MSCRWIYDKQQLFSSGAHSFSIIHLWETDGCLEAPCLSRRILLHSMIVRGYQHKAPITSFFLTLLTTNLQIPRSLVKTKKCGADLFNTQQGKSSRCIGIRKCHRARASRILRPLALS
jgi:hypothetical protein